MSESLDFLVIPIPLLVIPIPPSQILVIPIPLEMSNAVFRLYTVYIWHFKASAYANQAYEW